MKRTPWIKTFCIPWAALLLPCGQGVWALSRWWWLNDLWSPFFKGCLERYICIADPSQPWHQSLNTAPRDVCSLHKSRVWATGIFVCCLSQQFREGTNVNKVHGLLNSAFDNKAKTKDQTMLMPCLDLSLQPQASRADPSRWASWFHQIGKIWYGKKRPLH